ncbi:hypothetical protein L226DRAFT_378984 [Lentinus tigrinus ALCF2SS1-7]|uniref:Secreted protein n=1 Tax=Lentinus tigrinus ALCF2SS1-6 TaxID=1328759 RepID=A0A5C2SMD9_9APHY|nr:hypothetical protein L227DRAFT_325175 [Lentinus tigrinus ALCF2SS1-6]RPD76525.1 hypothetical protein L226DRAFT_378984 [Lentinus tigrinus ALCF2SS1-7]
MHPRAHPTTQNWCLSVAFCFHIMLDSAACVRCSLPPACLMTHHTSSIIIAFLLSVSRAYPLTQSHIPISSSYPISRIFPHPTLLRMYASTTCNTVNHRCD